MFKTLKYIGGVIVLFVIVGVVCFFVGKRTAEQDPDIVVDATVELTPEQIELIKKSTATEVTKQMNEKMIPWFKKILGQFEHIKPNLIVTLDTTKKDDKELWSMLQDSIYSIHKFKYNAGKQEVIWSGIKGLILAPDSKEKANLGNKSFSIFGTKTGLDMHTTKRWFPYLYGNLVTSWKIPKFSLNKVGIGAEFEFWYLHAGPYIWYQEISTDEMGLIPTIDVGIRKQIF